MDLSSLIVEVRDKALHRLGQISPVDLNLTISERFNNVGAWTVTLRSDHPLAGALRAPGAGIIVSDHLGTTLMSGPVILAEAKTTVEDPGGTLTIEGVTDLVLLADRLAFPDPADPDPASSNATAAHDIRTGAAETLMHQYVSANVGPTAPTARRDPRLQLGLDSGRGPVQTQTARFPGLGTLLNSIALGSGLGFRIVQVADYLEFQTFQVADRSALVRFDMANNMLSGETVQTAPPTVTRAIVGGEGGESDRQFIEVTSPDSLSAETLWGRRIEQFIDQRDTSDATQLTKAGQDAITQGGQAQLAVQLVPQQDIGAATYSSLWSLGDTVAVVVDGAQMPVQVTGYILKNGSQDGFQFGAVLGDPTAVGGATSQISAAVTTLDQRISNLELNSEDAGSSGSATLLWNGSAYVQAPQARHYVGPADPASFGAVADGSIWDEVPTA